METLLTTDEAARRVRLTSQTLRSMRMRGCGPTFVRLSANRVFYAPADLAEWVTSRKRRSTREVGVDANALSAA